MVLCFVYGVLLFVFSFRSHRFYCNSFSAICSFLFVVLFVVLDLESLRCGILYEWVIGKVLLVCSDLMCGSTLLCVGHVFSVFYCSSSHFLYIWSSGS